MADENNGNGTNTVLLVIILLIIVGAVVWWVAAHRGTPSPSNGANINVTVPTAVPTY